MIVEADAVVKGQTASSSYKPAMLDNGVRVMVPPHIGAGTRIVVDVYEQTYVPRGLTSPPAAGGAEGWASGLPAIPPPTPPAGGRGKDRHGFPFRPHHRHAARRAQGGAAACGATSARSSSCRSAEEGPGRLRLDGRQARRADADRGAAQRAARLGPPGEEAGEIAGDPDKPRWIVDPLDGTTNFLHGVPHFAISIAVEEPKPDGEREITHGLVYQPLTDESFWAEKGRGAWLNDRRLRVSARRDLTKR